MDDEESKEILYRLDERTEKIEQSNRRIEKRLNRHEKEIRANQRRTQSNDEKIKVGGFLGATGITAIVTKAAGVLPF